MWRRLCLVSICLVATGCASIQTAPIKVRAEGYGANCTEALKQAKIKASEGVSGTFISSHKSLVDDHKYTENVDEYSGGIVRSYKTISSSASNPCMIVIEAEVSSEASNIVLHKDGKLSLESVNDQLVKATDTKQTLRHLINRPEMFHIETTMASPRQQPNGDIVVNVMVRNVSPSPKWISDVQAFLEVHGSKYTYKEQSGLKQLGKALFVIAAIPLIIPVAIVMAPFARKNHQEVPQTINPADNFSICFAKADTFDCYQGWAVNEIYERLNTVGIEAVLTRDGNFITSLPNQKRHVSLIQQVSPNALWVDDENRPKQKFNVLTENKVSYETNLVLDKKWMEGGYSVEFQVRFN